MNLHLAHVEGSRSQVTLRPRPIVYIVDDDVSVVSSLEPMVCGQGWQPISFSSALEFLAHQRTYAPSCLVLDTMLPDLSGLELQRRVSGGRNDMPVIFISSDANILTAVQAMKAGAVEFLLKPFPEETVMNALRYAIHRSLSAVEREEELQELRDRYELLTERERQVMVLVVSGLLNKQVGGQLGISEITVKAHRGNVMRKMESTSLAELVTMATTLGVCPSRRGKRIQPAPGTYRFPALQRAAEGNFANL